MQQMAAASNNYPAPISTQHNGSRSNGSSNGSSTGQAKVDDDDDLVVTAITPGNDNKWFNY